MATIEFGAGFKKQFVLSDEVTFVNHAAAGALPLVVYSERLRLIQEMEQVPDAWFRHKQEQMWSDSIKAVSEFLGSKPSNLTFVSNTTTGINAVIRSLNFDYSDAILLTSWSYFAMKDTCQHVAKMQGVEVLYVDVPYPLQSAKQLLDCYEQMLIKHENIRLVLLDYITSVPSALLPLKELIALCRKYEKLVLVDGAHAPGHVTVNLEELGADFFSANLYKWSFASRGCAVLWVDPRFHGKIFPPVTAYAFYGEGEMYKNFLYQGFGDFTAFYSVRKAIDFYESLGGHKRISDYCQSLASEAADLLVRKLSTRHYPLPEDMKAPFMRMVALPKLNKYPPVLVGKKEVRRKIHNMDELNETVWARFGTLCVFVSVEDEGWIRICASVYNDISDYDRLADAIIVLVKEDQEHESQDRKEG